jgi:hypothetical protein
MSFILGLIVYAIMLGRLDAKLPWPAPDARGGRS